LGAALLAIVLKLGGRAGARLADKLGLVVGRDVLLRRAKGASLSDGAKVGVFGVDDFAFGKGHTYRTVLVAWMRKHPETRVATRDRSNIYREGLAKGVTDSVTDSVHRYWARGA